MENVVRSINFSCTWVLLWQVKIRARIHAINRICILTNPYFLHLIFMTTQPLYVRQDGLRQTHAPILALQMIGWSTPIPIRLSPNPKLDNTTIQPVYVRQKRLREAHVPILTLQVIVHSFSFLPPSLASGTNTRIQQ